MTSQFWEEFIEILKENPCIWDRKCADYINESKRNIAYGVLIEKLWEIDENADLTTVKKKIGSLKASYSREFARAEKAKEEGKSYKPGWQYYDSLKFLYYYKILETDSDEPQQEVEYILPNESQVNPPVVLNNPITVTPTPALVPFVNNNNKPAAKRMRPENDEVLEDDSSTFAAHITSRMRSFDPLQKCIAQKLISDVMFLADTKQLQLKISIVNLAERQD